MWSIESKRIKDVLFLHLVTQVKSLSDTHDLVSVPGNLGPIFTIFCHKNETGSKTGTNRFLISFLDSISCLVSFTLRLLDFIVFFVVVKFD